MSTWPQVTHPAAQRHELALEISLLSPYRNAARARMKEWESDRNQNASQVLRMTMGGGLGSVLSLTGPFTARVRWFFDCGQSVAVAKSG